MRSALPFLAATFILGCRPHGAPSSEPVTTITFDASVLTLPGAPCGPLECRAYDTVEQAIDSALASHPLIVSVGEAHAQKGATAPSAAKQFTETILPLLKGRASDLVVELMNPPQGCTQTTAKVREEQKVVTQKQAATDQNEYVTMGNRAHELGIVPDLLRPTCGDLDAVKAAGDDAVEASLVLIERLMRTQAEKLALRDQSDPQAAGKLVMTYGGALHVDPDPPKQTAAWSFGPALSEFTKGRYVAIDLYVPELMGDSDTWKKLPFYAHYDRAKMGGKTIVFRQGQAFVIVLPRTTNIE